MEETHRRLLAALLAAEHGAPPMHGAQPHVEAVHQLVPVLQLDQLEGLLGAQADDDGVGQQVGALRLLDGQHLAGGKKRKRWSLNGKVKRPSFDCRVKRVRAYLCTRCRCANMISHMKSRANVNL